MKIMKLGSRILQYVGRARAGDSTKR